MALVAALLDDRGQHVVGQLDPLDGEPIFQVDQSTLDRSSMADAGTSRPRALITRSTAIF